MSLHEIDISVDELIDRLLGLSGNVCILDSCGVRHLGSHLMVAGIEPLSVHKLTGDDTSETLEQLDNELEQKDRAVFLTIGYEFGSKLNKIPFAKNKIEPDIFLASFDTILVHDYAASKTFLTGNADKFKHHEEQIQNATPIQRENSSHEVTCNFDRNSYIRAVEEIRELIRAGDTYQTNLTMQVKARFADNVNAAAIFRHLRENNPAPFAAYINRGDSAVVSSSPERFIRVENGRIDTSPIKGTRPRLADDAENERIKAELLASEKDRAENIMIVDLLRNDIGRVCEFGSVRVEKLCDLEEHPTLFHLVSTVSGTLRPETKPSDILSAIFPCGSITGAPKIRTMQLINAIENTERGLSMGAIGYSIKGDAFAIGDVFDLNVAIRTMTVAGRECTFNVGGGIVIDSDPAAEYDEALLKAKALIAALSDA